MRRVVLDEPLDRAGGADRRRSVIGDRHADDGACLGEIKVAVTKIEALRPVQALQEHPMAIGAAVAVGVGEHVDDLPLARLAHEEGTTGAETHESGREDPLGEEFGGVALGGLVAAQDDLLGGGFDATAGHESHHGPVHYWKGEAGSDSEQTENPDRDQRLAHVSLRPRAPWRRESTLRVRGCVSDAGDSGACARLLIRWFFAPWGLDESPKIPDT